MILRFTDTDLLSAEQQIRQIEGAAKSTVNCGIIQKLRRKLKRDYERKAISTLMFVDLSQRVNNVSRLLN